MFGVAGKEGGEGVVGAVVGGMGPTMLPREVVKAAEAASSRDRMFLFTNTGAAGEAGGMGRKGGAV